MGNMYEYVKMAVQNILANKGRSLLTMLGIIIGIASVIMIVSIGDGTTAEMNKTMDNVGGGQIAIMCSNDASAAGEWITGEDLDAVRNTVEGVIGVEAGNGLSGETTTAKGTFNVSLSGGTQDGLLMNNMKMKRGSYLRTEDVQEGRNVCVISDTDAKRLFGSDDVVGMDVDVMTEGMSLSFRIQGVSVYKDDSATVSYLYGDSPVSLSIPYTALSGFTDDYDQFYSIMVQADKTLDSAQIADEVVKLLEKRHQSAGLEYFQVQTFQDVLKQLNDVMGVMTAFISFVAGISLLVGGIGVMNIMLVSVTERTREIGIRKSLGARTSSIMMQFLAESAIITALGGVIGIILGLAGAFGICSLMSGAQGMEIAPAIKLSTILTATVFSCAVGIFFGIYPARKAAKLSPIEALRRN